MQLAKVEEDKSSERITKRSKKKQGLKSFFGLAGMHKIYQHDGLAEPTTVIKN